jgi:cytochrome P450
MSQAFIFLIAGSETTATTMTYVAYLLAKNPQIQAKLYNEIEKAFNEHVSLLT